MKKLKFIYALQILVGLLFIFSSCVSCSRDTYQEKDFDFQGYRIHYELYGDKHAAKTLVFVHGWCGNIDIWTNQVNAFPEYKVIAIDLPGHGKSSKEVEADYNIGLFVNSISAILENEKVEKAFIFGHSMGFAVSEVFALKYPEKTVGIGSIDGAHFEVDNDEKSQNEWIEYNHWMAESLNEEKGREDFISMLFLPETPAAIKTDILEKSKSTPLIIGKKIIASMVDDMTYWEERIVNIPCFVIHTPVYQLSDEYRRDFMKMYPEADYHEIDGVSHFFMLEVPDTLNKLMSDFLKAVY